MLKFLWIVVFQSLNVLAVDLDESSLYSNLEIGPYELCYEECQDRKEFFDLFGKEQSGKNRESCLECVQKIKKINRSGREISSDKGDPDQFKKKRSKKALRQ